MLRCNGWIATNYYKLLSPQSIFPYSHILQEKAALKDVVWVPLIISLSVSFLVLYYLLILSHPHLGCLKSFFAVANWVSRFRVFLISQLIILRIVLFFFSLSFVSFAASSIFAFLDPVWRPGELWIYLRRPPQWWHHNLMVIYGVCDITTTLSPVLPGCPIHAWLIVQNPPTSTILWPPPFVNTFIYTSLLPSLVFIPFSSSVGSTRRIRSSKKPKIRWISTFLQLHVHIKHLKQSSNIRCSSINEKDHLQSTQYSR